MLLELWIETRPFQSTSDIDLQKTRSPTGKNIFLTTCPNPIALDFALHVEQRFAALMQTAAASAAAGPTLAQSLGGKLVYMGELDAEGRAWMVAANIAGGASLAVCADPAAQKQAIRDGVADFLVTDLDEALRILKNEIRKHETVAVCIGNAHQAIEREMAERGVVPDLLPRFGLAEEPEPEALVSWSVGSAPAQWLPRLDALAIDSVEGDAAAQRWLRLAPRYLGRGARNVRVLRCASAAAERFIARAREAVESGEIGVDVEIKLNGSELLLR